MLTRRWWPRSRPTPSPSCGGLALQGDCTQQQLNQYALNVLKKRLETIDGVGEVRLGGRRDRTIRVDLLPERMAAHKITAQDISEAFAREHVQLAGGFVVGSTTESLVKLDLEFHQVEQLRELIVAWRDKAPVRLGDVAQIDDGLADKRQLARFNGQTTIGLGMVKIANANTVAITERIQERVDKELRPALPPGMTLSVVSNDAVFIIEIVDSLKEHLIEGTLLAALVVWVFLRSVRSTLIISLAIPVSLMGAIAVIYFAGFTLNSLTMLGLLLLIGVVVDDAIVVLENIFRHRETLDPDPVSAAINGSNEVVFAVMAATLSLVCIFAPVAFISGIIGQFFRSFALVVTFGVLVSLFVSLTLTPMLCSRYLKVESSTAPSIAPSTASSPPSTPSTCACWRAPSPTACGWCWPPWRWWLRAASSLPTSARPSRRTPRGALPGVAAHAAGLQHRLHRRQAAQGRGHPRQAPGDPLRVLADRPRRRRAG